MPLNKPGVLIPRHIRKYSLSIRYEGLKLEAGKDESLCDSTFVLQESGGTWRLGSTRKKERGKKRPPTSSTQ